MGSGERACPVSSTQYMLVESQVWMVSSYFSAALNTVD